jgi:hypothetical protein
MHAPPCFGKFLCSVGKFSKATPACKVSIVLFGKFSKVSLPHALQQVLFSF